jgi:hypothetical protein
MKMIVADNRGYFTSPVWKRLDPGDNLFSDQDPAPGREMVANSRFLGDNSLISKINTRTIRKCPYTVRCLYSLWDG